MQPLPGVSVARSAKAAYRVKELCCGVPRLSSSDSEILREAARLGLSVVSLGHSRQRISGALGVLAREGRVVALCAHACGLTAVPESVLALQQLERLDLGGNAISSLPAALSRWRSASGSSNSESTR